MVAQTALSPIQQVPFDIIGEIALLCLPSQPSLARSDAPLSLCQISSAWRGAALTISCLWSDLYVDILAGKDFPRCAIAINEWSRRASDTPFSLSLFLTSKSLDASTDPYEDDEKWEVDNRPVAFISSISRCLTDRVRHLCIGAEWMPGVLSLFKDISFCRLESLTLMITGEGRRTLSDYPLHEILTHAPNLNTVLFGPQTFSEVGPEPDNLSICQKLTHLYLGEAISASRAIETLSACPNLISCQISIYAHETLPEPSLLHTLTLETLNIDLYRGHATAISCAADILRHFSLPRLRCLVVAHNSPSIHFTTTSDNFQLDELPSLQRLCLVGTWSSHLGSYYTLLRVAVNLTYLEMDIVTMWDQKIPELISFLTWIPSSRVLPNLSTLHVQMIGRDTHALKQFVDVVRSRLGSKLELANFYSLYWSSDFSRIQEEVDTLLQASGDFEMPTFGGEPVLRALVSLKEGNSSRVSALLKNKRNRMQNNLTLTER